jgi:uncharacterized protein (DUF1501 family)
MNRRKFLSSSTFLSVPVLFKGIPVFAGNVAMHPFLTSLLPPVTSCGKILVVIQMNGGNDGLNTVIPLDRYTELSNARSNVLIPQASVLPLTGTATTGLHPSMTGLRDLYNNGFVNIVQGVSYPNPNFSHFQAQDMWFTATTTLPTPDTGWLGRQLDINFPGFPVGYPNASNPDPLAVQIGGALPLALQGQHINMGYNTPDPETLVNVATATPAPAPASDYGTELTFLRMMKDQSNAYTSRITASYNAQATMSSMYPATGNNSLADQLKIVARLIGGGLATQIYIVNHPESFDTHVEQVTHGDSLSGRHAESLSKLSVAIAAFQNDIGLMGKANSVTGMTFSEFGRRVASNTSFGTDHGTAAPVLFFGAGVKSGIIGTSPVLPTNPGPNTQVPMQYDFRQLYATVMQKWMCMSSADSQSVLNGVYSTLPIFNEVILPLDGITLSAAWEGDFAKLQFDVFENDKYDLFVVERSATGNAFEQVNNIVATAGINRQYDYKDTRQHSAEVFYRIKGITKQGMPVFSPVVKLKNTNIQQVRVYPNPVINFTITIEFLNRVNENVTILILGTKGEKLYYNQLNPGGNRSVSFKVPQMFDVQTLYILNITYSGNVINEKILFSR